MTDNNAAETNVRRILKDYIKWLEVEETDEYKKSDWKYKNVKRLEFDKDAKYYKDIKKLSDEDALLADTIFSFWTPYKTLLLKEANWNVSKTHDSIKTLLKQTDKRYANIYTPKILEVNKKMEKFADVCYTKGNFMLLPQRKMNNFRYQVTEDRIDMTIYECFNKGALSKFFSNEHELYAWIERENLLHIFIENKVSKDKINWLINEKSPKLISEMEVNEIYEYLEKGINFIGIRNT